MKYTVIVHNDNVNTFDNVINSLVEICNHDTLQAGQCAMLIDKCGKTDVKSGRVEDMTHISSLLKERGLRTELVSEY